MNCKTQSGPGFYSARRPCGNTRLSISFAAEFKDEGQIIENYLQSLPAPKATLARAQLALPQHQLVIQRQVKALLARMLFKNAGYYSIIAPAEPEVEAARNILGSSSYDALIGR